MDETFEEEEQEQEYEQEEQEQEKERERECLRIPKNALDIFGYS